MSEFLNLVQASLVPIAGGILAYLVMIERRLTKLETTIELHVSWEMKQKYRTDKES